MSKRNLLIRIGFDMEAFSTSSQNLSRSLKKTADKMKSIGSSMSTYLTAPIVALGVVAAKSAADIESLKLSLQTALGGTATEAENAFKKIEGFASKTPFALQEVTESFIKLKNMGLDPSMDALRSYGNTSSAMGKSLNQMVEAVADAAVGEFERLKEFGIKAKSEGDKVSFTFKGVTTQIGKNSQEIEQYLQNIGNTAFAGGIEKQSQSFNGMISTMKDNLSLAAASIGEVFLPYLKDLSAFISNAANSFRNLSPEVKKTILIVAALAAAIGPLIFAVGALTAAFAFLAANPIVLIITGIVIAIAGLVAAIIYVRNNFQAFADFFYNLWVKVANNFISVIQKIAKGYFYIVDLFGLDIGNTLSDFLEGLKLTARDSTKKFDTLGETIDKVKSKFTKAISPTKELTKEVKSLGESAEEVTAKATIMTDTIKDFSKLKMPKLDVKFAGGSGRSSISEASKSLLNELDLLAQEAKMKATKIGEDISEALTQGLQRLVVDSAVIMGEFLGGLATGDANVEDFGKNILNAIGSFMSQFGQAMIAIGIAQAGINAAIASMNPVLAIAGGIALVAAGAALSNVASRGIEGASGGSSYSSPTYSGNPSFDTAQYESMTSISGRDIRIIQRRESGFTR